MILLKRRCLDCQNLVFDRCEISGKSISGAEALKTIPSDCPLIEYNALISAISGIEDRLTKLEEFFARHIQDCHKPIKETC